LEKHLDQPLANETILKVKEDAQNAAGDHIERLAKAGLTAQRRMKKVEAVAATAATAVLQESSVWGYSTPGQTGAIEAANAARIAMKWAARVKGEPARPSAKKERAAQAALLRDIFGPLPFRKVNIDPAWVAWNNGTVKSLAEAAYSERALPTGTFDLDLLGVLADALEDCGCTATDLVTHLRGPGSHVRGCWAIDLLTARE